MQVVLAAINSKYVHTALGLRYINEYCRMKKHQTTLIEETINTPALVVLENLMAQQADVYAFSVHIWNKTFVFSLIRLLKKLKPAVKIVIGGPEVAFDVQKIFTELPEADYIVQGEGEICFEQLLSYLEGRGELPLHIAYIKDGRAELNGGVTCIEDLSILPFPYPDLAKIIEEHKIVYYECSRGCPFNCSYCLSGISRNVRKRPVELVLADLNRFIEAKVPLVKFVDRTYNLDENYYLPIMEYLAKLETDTTFHFEIKADILNARVLEFLKTVPEGRFQLEIGIQTTNPETLSAINRKDNWEKLSRNVNYLLANKNMHIHLDLIAGLPYEGLAEFARSFDDVYSLQPQMLQLGFLKVLPGTQMSRETELHQLIYMDEPPYEILATKYISYEDLQLLKQIENVFEQTYNTGFFENTLKYLIKQYNKGSFAFYHHLTEWWLKNGHYPQSHNVKGTAKILYDYILENVPEHTELLEILKYDIFTKVQGWRPEWLNWNSDVIFAETSAFWRDEEKVKQYLPDYKFSSWRQINKTYPIELFSFNPEESRKEKFYLLLDYSKEKMRKLKLKL